MIRIDRKAIDFAKSGLFASFGTATDADGARFKIELTDDLLHEAAMLALDHLAVGVFGVDAFIKIDKESE